MSRRVLVLALLHSGVGVAASAAPTDATTSASFLKLPVGARNSAMGATGAAEASAYSTYWNPAGLASVTGRELAYSYTSWLVDVSYQFLGYAQATRWGTFAVSAQYVSVPAIDKYDNTGTALGSQYRPLDSLVGLSYARQVAGLGVGASLKHVRSELDDRSAQSLAADVGVRSGPLLGRELFAGFALQNLGPGLKFDRERAPLPLNLKFGASYRAAPGLTLALDLNEPRGADATVNGGVEYRVAVGSGAAVVGRGGYETGRGGLGGMAGLTTGLGLDFSRFTFDYAFIPMGDFGDAHRLSLGARF